MDLLYVFLLLLSVSLKYNNGVGRECHIRRPYESMHSMNYLGKFISNFRYVYNEINAATLTGAIDVVIVEQPDGTFTCSPFHVRFGKIGVLRSREKVVDIEINGEPVDIHMKLGESGEAFFVEEVSADELGDDSIPPHLACSPIPREGSFHERYLLKDTPDSEPWNQQRFEGGVPNEGCEDKEGGLELSSTPKVVVAGGGSVVKTFKAETVEELANHKLSSASAEFKPITTVETVLDRESEGSAESIPAKGISNLDLNKDDDSPPSERVSTSLPGNKRKRRKRSLLKKKNNNTNQRRNSNQDQIDVAAEPKKEQADFDAIFQMEDLDQKSIITVSTAAEPQKNTNQEELAHIKDAPVETDIHFFSDTELTPGSSPHDNRQFTPVQSDTEFETKRLVSEVDEKVGDGGPQQSWRWGELPSPSLDDPSKEDAQRSMLHNMLGFMKKTKHIRHNSQGKVEQGIYLSDINPDQLDPEVAALYFPTNYKQQPSETKNGKDEDAESGNGPSLPHSPHSVEGAIGGPKSVDSDFEEPKKSYGEIAMSLCGGLTLTSTPSEESFLHHIITYDEFVSSPTLINNPNLVIRVDGKMHNWRTASPVIMALAAFQKPLPQEVVSSLAAEYTSAGVSVSDQRRPRRGYSSWFTWGKGQPQNAIESNAGNNEEQQSEKPENEPLQSVEETTIDSLDNQSTPLELDTEESAVDEVQLQTVETKEEKNTTPADEQYQGSNSSDSDSENDRKRLKSQGLKIPLSREKRSNNGSDKFRKTLRLTSEQIASLNLQEGENEIEFSVTTAYQGTSRCKCFLFKWRYDDKIVVSDIDGTITKSDVLGHILPIMGKDWAQSGVAKLFTKIRDNGYKLLYLSARAIGQSRLTRDYLKSIKQEDLSLPEGPMLLNPTSLLNALHREVIEKKPEEFKISCLRDIQALFPPNVQPFYAGYGNKINDVWAYQAVGIPIVRIFTINHRGELKHELTQTFQSSYSNMSYIVDQMFPAKQQGGALQDDFSQFVYWREPIPEVDLTLQPVA